MGRFSQSELDEFAAKAAWARNQAQAATDDRLQHEYLALALAFERLVQEIGKAQDPQPKTPGSMR
jgi:hypothetical protein